MSFGITTVLFPFFLLFPVTYCQNQYNDDVYDFVGIEKEHIRRIMKKLENLEDSAEVLARMIDSSTKIPSGIANGNPFDLGNFDECYNIHSGNIYGKYCLGTIPIDISIMQKLNITQHKKLYLTPQPRLMGLGSDHTGFHWAACVPNTMKAEEIHHLLQTYNKDYCYSKDTDPELSTGAIVTIVILAVFLSIIAASTILDIYLYYTKKESPHELLIAFSYLTNGRKLFTTTTNPDQLLCLNGLRAISMMWVILGHEYESASYYGPVANFIDVQDWQNNAANMFMGGSSVSVDTFFLIGGLVTVYAFLKSMDKGVKFNIFLYYIHRYLRLTPAVAIMVLIYTFLLPYVGNGPLWHTVEEVLVQPCKKGWWPTLIYLANYIQQGYCDPPTWYLSVDMQLFILSPIILVPLSKWPRYGLYGLGILALAGVVIPFGITYAGEIYSSMEDEDKYMNQYYYQTHTRFGPYIIGMIAGYYIYKLKKSGNVLRLRPIVVAILWLVTLTGLVACVYAGYDLNVATEYDRLGNSMFLALNRPSWSVSLGILIFLCVAEYGGPINAFLALPVFQFITKLSYSMYLVHYAIIIIRYSVMRNVFMFSDILTMHNFWGDFMLTLLFSLILCLSFESPIIILEKYLFGKGSSRGQIKKKTAV